MRLFQLSLSFLLALTIYQGPLLYATKFQTLPAELDGTMMPYNFNAVEPLPDFGDTLKPIYIDYLARHGARYLSSKEKISRLEQRLESAKIAGNISGAGKNFLKLISNIKYVTDGEWGALNPLGSLEQKMLASVMASQFASLFQNSPDVVAMSSYVPRVVMTMYDFCHCLSLYSLNSINISTSEGPIQNPLLRFFQTDTTYRNYLLNGEWHAVEQAFYNLNVPIGPAQRLFKPTAHINDKELRSITMELYSILQSLRAAGLPAPTTEWMSLDEYKACWATSNLRHYLQRIPNSLSSLPATGAAKLINSIISSADSAANCKDKPRLGATLRFGHAETILPVVGTLGIVMAQQGQPGDKPVADYAELPRQFQDWWTSPLGANLQIIILRSDSGTIYSLVRLNGRNVEPFKNSGLIVAWDEVRDLWKHRLSALSMHKPE